MTGNELPPNLLVAYCDTDEVWYKFDSETDTGLCPTCGGRPSAKHGHQITTQRSFDPKAKKLTKAQLKRMGMGA